MSISYEQLNFLGYGYFPTAKKLGKQTIKQINETHEYLFKVLFQNNVFIS